MAVRRLVCPVLRFGLFCGFTSQCFEEYKVHTGPVGHISTAVGHHAPSLLEGSASAFFRLNNSSVLIHHSFFLDILSLFNLLLYYFLLPTFMDYGPYFQQTL